MAEAPTTPDDERDRIAREDEERERAAQGAEEHRFSDATDLPPSDHLPADEPPTADPPALVEPTADTGSTDSGSTDSGSTDTGSTDTESAAALDRERREQADDESPSATAQDPDYDAIPAKDHVAHGDAGTDIVDEPGEPDVPEQEEYTPTVAVPAGMSLTPEASDAVFVEPPVEPRARHNRLFGVGMVLLSTIVFSALYAVLAAVPIGFRTPTDRFTEAMLDFLRGPAFGVPIVAYAVLGVLSALLVNRARWWAYALLSLVVGVLVWVISVAVVLLLAGWFASDAAAQRDLLVKVVTQPVLIAAGIAARETLLWFGLGIAARGRRVVARNRRERDDYESRLSRSEAVWDGGAA